MKNVLKGVLLLALTAASTAIPSFAEESVAHTRTVSVSEASNYTAEVAAIQSVGTYATTDSASELPLTVNGILLGQSKSAVVKYKGAPSAVSKDSWLGTVEYKFRDGAVGFYEGTVEYISIPATKRFMSVNGRQVGISKAGLNGYFGKPDYVAEDGYVYERASDVIKAFTHPKTGAVIGVDYFSKSAI
ncbi:hypothetical protein SY83_19515 [Paenibacillus swuensis]|uniref:Copper amine oxidase-like N-terminal domain-containing protein n=1 Tax=Paenibacillus swuensis TaxID=1178515 RepID=A0A172TMH8_9BACL|nr:hypothetical protein [Paenibacillus swuensis]ANE48114.1 hypothetical protein SY83_19515 [Paenibacillus swuensis]